MWLKIAIGSIAAGLAAAAFHKLFNNENCVDDDDNIITSYEKLLEEVGIMTNNNMNIGPTFLCGKENNALFHLPKKEYVENYLSSFVQDPYNNQFTQSLMESEVDTGLESALKCLRNKNYEDVEEACKRELEKKKNKNKKRRLMRKIRRTLALNLLATFAILRGNYATAVKHLTTVIETPRAPKELVRNSLLKRSSVLYQQKELHKSLEDLTEAERLVI